MTELTAGTWHSTYTYESSSRAETLTDERDVDLNLAGQSVWIASQPADPSLLEMNLTAEGNLLTGTWRERTDPAGYYAGAAFTGAAQFILAGDGLSMFGRWVGHSRDLSEVNAGTWTLILA
jgi:hypothetical protein